VPEKYKERQRFFQKGVVALCGTGVLQAVSGLFDYYQLIDATSMSRGGLSDSRATGGDRFRKR